MGAIAAVPWWLDLLVHLPEELMIRLLKRAPAQILRGLREAWFWQVHDGQEEPEGDRRVWLIMAGRGFGKTRAGACWLTHSAPALTTSPPGGQ